MRKPVKYSGDILKAKKAAIEVFNSLKPIPYIGLILGHVAVASVLAVAAEKLKGRCSKRQWSAMVDDVIEETTKGGG
jgi:hypothetical protein